MTAVHMVTRADVLSEDARAHDPISTTHVSELNHPVQIGKWIHGNFFPATPAIYDLEGLKTWILRRRIDDDHNRLPPTNPATNLPIQNWRTDVDPVEWFDPPPHLENTDYVEESEFHLHITRCRNAALTDYFTTYSLYPMERWHLKRVPDSTLDFRQEMSEWSWKAMPESRVDNLERFAFVLKYWRFHAYTKKDRDSGVEQPNWELIGKMCSIHMPTMEEYHEFRMFMVDTIKQSPIDIEESMAHAYWQFHPLDKYTDCKEVQEAYQDYILRLSKH